MKPTTPQEDLLRGIWRENPVLVQLLGLCPTLAVTNTVANSIAMGVATFFVLCGSSLLVSIFKRFVPNQVRISTYILIIATFVTVADMCLEAVVPAIHKALGAFVALIVVNCIILGRAEAFASKNGVFYSFLDGLGIGLGYTLALIALGSIREILGKGSFYGMPVFGPSFQPFSFMVEAPGAFVSLGLMLCIMNMLGKK